MWRCTLLCLLVLVLTIGCLTWPASAGTIRDDVDDSAYTKLATSYPSVGQFTWTSFPYQYSASGVLIAEDWVLTAGHVVDDANASLTFTLGGDSYSATSWIAYPGWSGNVSKGYDIGLVHLSQSVSVTPADRYRGTDSPLGKVGTSVGYGLTGTGLTGYDELSGLEKRAGQNVVDAWYLGPGKPGRTPTVFLSDFDNPSDPGDNYSGTADPLDLEYLIAPGDSGGGVFADYGQKEYLIGINSFIASVDGSTNSDYGDISGHTWVPFFNGWIDSIIGGSGGGHGGNGGGKPDKPPKGPKNKNSAGAASGGAVVPEPSTLWLLCIGGLFLAGCWRRRTK
jgi:hypothetical protein